MAPKFIRRFGKTTKPWMTTPVPCRPLSALMAEVGLSSATFLNLDVEGAEELVLRTVDPRAFRAIMVELDGTNKAKDDSVVELLLQVGFRPKP